MTAGRHASIRRTVQVTLRPDQIDPVESYAKMNNCASLSEAIRELVAIALASTPMDGLMSSGRIRAFNEVRQWAITETVHALRGIAARLDASTAADKALPRQEPFSSGPDVPSGAFISFDLLPGGL